MNKYLRWAPRILSIVYILFLMLFSLDVIKPGLNTKEIVWGLFMHNVPALILLVFVVVSWRYEIVGGLFFLLSAAALIILSFLNGLVNADSLIAVSVLAGPAILIGLLFILNWLKRETN